MGPGKTSFCDDTDSGCTFLLSRGSHKGRKVIASFSLVEPEIIVQYSEQFDLGFSDLEDAEVTSVFRPVNVLRTRVVEILGSNDQCRQEYPMACSLRICLGQFRVQGCNDEGIRHTSDVFGQPCAKTFQINESGKESRDMNV